MAGTINKVILIGRLGADPDVRYMADGTPVVTFNMATNEPVRSAEGTWEERAEWHRIVAYRKLAENMANFLNKGRLVYVEGKLQTRQWQDAQGVKRYTTEIVARDIKLMDSSGNRPAQSPTGETYPRTGGVPSTGGSSDMEELPPPPNSTEDDIPF
jgi:single-strand DNA-binding protein